MTTFNQISDISDIDQIIVNSKDKPQILFKHSTVCPISRISYEKMKNEYPYTDQEADLFYIGVIEQRPISNYIAEILEVKHESPQVIVIKGGQAVFDESHLMIKPRELKEYT